MTYGRRTHAVENCSWTMLRWGGGHQRRRGARHNAVVAAKAHSLSLDAGEREEGRVGAGVDAVALERRRRRKLAAVGRCDVRKNVAVVDVDGQAVPRLGFDDVSNGALTGEAGDPPPAAGLGLVEKPFCMISEVAPGERALFSCG